MTGLFEILMGEIDKFQYLYPQINLVCQKSITILEHLVDKDISGEAIVRQLENKVQNMIKEAMDSVNEHISGTV